MDITREQEMAVLGHALRRLGFSGEYHIKGRLCDRELPPKNHSQIVCAGRFCAQGALIAGAFTVLGRQPGGIILEVAFEMARRVKGHLDAVGEVALVGVNDDWPDGPKLIRAAMLARIRELQAIA